MAKNKMGLDGAVGFEGTVTVKIRKELFISMHKIAKEHRDRAKQVASNDIQNMNDEIDESMISILFSYTCLEAFINTIIEDRLGNDRQRYEGISTEAKWMGVSKFLATKKFGKPHSVFSKGDEPFKSFQVLEKIREDYIVHRPAKFGEVTQTKYGNTDGTIDVLNCDNAEWACNVVKNIVTKLCENIENPPAIDWLN
jgi:hypothetical protein